MLSILIPVHNYNPGELIKELFKQATESGAEFEIILGDDASRVEYQKILKSFLLVGKVKIVRNDENIGRAAIRNRLADASVFPWFLFIDADAAIGENFLKEYIDLCSKNAAEVIVGGTVYSNKPPEDKNKLLRWNYGRKREEKLAVYRMKSPFRSFSTFNFVASRDTFSKVRFNENLRGYGHEDTLFGMELEKKHIKILHVDNPAVHAGIENAACFLEKSREGVRSLLSIYGLYGNPVRYYSSLLRLNLFFRSIGLANVFRFLFRKLGPFLEKKLKSSTANLYLFDFYRFLFSFSI